MFSVDLSVRERGGHVIVGLRAELDLAAAASVAASLAAIAASQPQIIVDLAGLDFVDSCGVAALAHGRRLARQAGGDTLLAAPSQSVLLVLASIRLIDAFRVHPSVDEAAGEVTPDFLRRASGTAGTAPLLRGPFAAGHAEARRSQQQDRGTGGEPARPPARQSCPPEAHLDHQHHRGRCRRDPRSARDGRPRGRRATALLLAPGKEACPPAAAGRHPLFQHFSVSPDHRAASLPQTLAV